MLYYYPDDEDRRRERSGGNAQMINYNVYVGMDPRRRGPAGVLTEHALRGGRFRETCR
jgi:hypothetical protein